MFAIRPLFAVSLAGSIFTIEYLSGCLRIILKHGVFWP
jgi:hypothetical protein